MKSILPQIAQYSQIKKLSPETLPSVHIEGIPELLKKQPNWVMWRMESRSNGNSTKVPYNVRTGSKASTSNPDTWGSFEECINALSSGSYTGIGFVLTKESNIICIDLDDKYGSGHLEEFFTMARSFNTYSEISHSGNGIHIWCIGKKNSSRCRSGNVEIYDSSHYIAITGNRVDGTPGSLNYAQNELDKLFTRKDRKETKVNMGQKSDESLSDEQIIQRASQSSSKFRRLWEGDYREYSSHSEADLALVSILVRYVQNPIDIDRLFRKSNLMRDKWLRDDYRNKTIIIALEKNEERSFPDHHLSSTQPSDSKRKTQLGTPFDQKTYALTDIGNAERFVDQFGEVVRYCTTDKQWYIWDEMRWKPDILLKCENLAINTVRSIYGEASRTLDENERKRIAQWAKVSEAHNRRVDLLKTASSMVTINSSSWDAHPDLFNLKNGTYNLKTHEFRNHRRDDFLTLMAGIEYQPDQICPVWERHLNVIFNGDTDLISAFQEISGYSLLSGNPDEIFCVCWGQGRNGKGKTFDALSFVHGEYAKSVPFTTFIAKKYGRESTNDIARLKGARFVKASESEEGDHLSESLIKSLSGGDIITARRLYREFEEFSPEFIIFLQTNHKPTIRNWDDAIDARLWLIPFTRYLEPQDRDSTILDKFKIEGSGIFNWMLEGLKRYQARGKLHKPEAVMSATGEYRKEQDRIGGFVSLCCIKDKDSEESKTRLYEEYKKYTLQNSEEPISQNLFSRLLQKNHNVKEGNRKPNERRWSGIRLKTSTELQSFTETKLYNESDNPYQDNLNGSNSEHNSITHCHDTMTDDDGDFHNLSSREENFEKLHNFTSDVSLRHQTLDEWRVVNNTPLLPDPSKYSFVSNTASLRCIVQGCSSPPLKAVNNSFPLCQKHFKEYELLYRNDNSDDVPI